MDINQAKKIILENGVGWYEITYDGGDVIQGLVGKTSWNLPWFVLANWDAGGFASDNWILVQKIEKVSNQPKPAASEQPINMTYEDACVFLKNNPMMYAENPETGEKINGFFSYSSKAYITLMNDSVPHSPRRCDLFVDGTERLFWEVKRK